MPLDNIGHVSTSIELFSAPVRGVTDVLRHRVTFSDAITRCYLRLTRMDAQSRCENVLSRVPCVCSCNGPEQFVGVGVINSVIDK